MSPDDSGRAELSTEIVLKKHLLRQTLCSWPPSQWMWVEEGGGVFLCVQGVLPICVWPDGRECPWDRPSAHTGLGLAWGRPSVSHCYYDSCRYHWNYLAWTVIRMLEELVILNLPTLCTRESDKIRSPGSFRALPLSPRWPGISSTVVYLHSLLSKKENRVLESTELL